MIFHRLYHHYNYADSLMHQRDRSPLQQPYLGTRVRVRLDYRHRWSVPLGAYSMTK